MVASSRRREQGLLREVDRRTGGTFLETRAYRRRRVHTSAVGRATYALAARVMAPRRNHPRGCLGDKGSIVGVRLAPWARVQDPLPATLPVTHPLDRQPMPRDPFF